MGELTAGDVQTYTSGRLTSGDGEVQRMLNAALMVARREVGWFVSPVEEDYEVTLDGPDSRVLWLPTLKLVTLTSIVEDDVSLDMSTVRASTGDTPGRNRRVAVRKRSGNFWSDEYGSIVVTMDHGFTEAEAVDWRQAILSMVDQMSLLPVRAATGSSDFGVASKRIDDIQLNWSSPYAAMAEEVIFSIGHIIDKYKLADLEFL